MGFGIRRWDAFGSTPVIESCKPNYRLGSRLCENARDWRPDRVRSDTGEDFADRHGKISRIEPREHLMILRSSARG